MSAKIDDNLDIPNRLSPLGWFVASTVIGISLAAYASGFVFTRTEGELLEKRVDKVESETMRRLERIEDKIDKLAESKYRKR